MSEPENAGGNQGGRFQPGASGNPSGKPRGARHRVTLAAEALLDGEGEALTRKAIELALDGDTIALRLCLERLVPPRKDRPLQFDLPPITGVQDHPAALAAVIAAVASGDLMPTEAQAFAAIMESHRRAIETSDLIARLEALEGKEAK